MEIGQNYVVVTPVAVPKNISVAHGGGIITVNSGGTLSIDSFDDSNFTGSQMFAGDALGQWNLGERSPRHGLALGLEAMTRRR